MKQKSSPPTQAQRQAGAAGAEVGPKPLYQQASEAMGAKGGRNGTGKAKTRKPEHYRVTLSEGRAKARLKRQLEKLG